MKRPKWLTPTDKVPKGYDLAPGYEYFSGLLVLYPNSTVGLNVKAFSSRVSFDLLLLFPFLPFNFALAHVSYFHNSLFRSM